MGSGSDFTAFQDFAGIPSVDMGFGFDSKSAIYHYHSNFDSLDWMERFGDPTFEYHATIAKIWALVAAKLVETPVLPLDASGYALGLQEYVDSVKKKAEDSGYLSTLSSSYTDDEFSWTALDDAVTHFTFAAIVHDGTAAQLLDDYSHIDDIPWWQPWKRVQLYLAIRAVNTKYKLLERKFLYPRGLDGRSWFKHIIFAPGKWTGYAGATFPGIMEAIDEKDDEAARKWIGIAANLINDAAEWLEE